MYANKNNKKVKKKRKKKRKRLICINYRNQRIFYRDKMYKDILIYTIYFTD